MGENNLSSTCSCKGYASYLSEAGKALGIAVSFPWIVYCGSKVSSTLPSQKFTVCAGPTVVLGIAGEVVGLFAGLVVDVLIVTEYLIMHGLSEQDRSLISKAESGGLEISITNATEYAVESDLPGQNSSVTYAAELA
jgi:hypothetical protein